jgi:hypothetical protein
MNFKHQLGIGAATGIAINHAQQTRALARYGQMIDAQVNQDCRSLGATGILSPITPPPPPHARRSRNLFAVAALGAAATGAAFGALTCLFIVIGSAAAGDVIGRGIVGGVFFGFVVGLVTMLMPGLIVGLILQRREAGRQYALHGHDILMDFHHERERIRHAVDEERLTPYEAAQELASMVSD